MPLHIVRPIMLLPPARIDTALRMHQDGYRKDEIAAAMNITQKTVTRYLKDASLRESGQEAAA